MKRTFIKTQNVKRFITLMEELKKLPPNIPKLALVYGEHGLGKTKTIHWWADKNDSVYVRATQGMTSRWLLSEIAEELGEEPFWHTQETFGLIENHLRINPKIIIVDEIDYLIEKNTIKENMHEYILSNNKKVYILPSIKEEIDKFDYNKLLNRRKLYSNMPFCNFSEKDIIDKVKNIISYIDDKLISYKEFYNYLDNINLDFTSEKKMYDNNLEFLYTNKLYYETLRDNINNDSLIKNCSKIIICIDKLIKKINN